MPTLEITEAIRKYRRPIEWVVTENGCWNCVSHTLITGGYPTINIENHMMRLNRYMYEKYKNKIPKGLVIRHTCDNPACINPQHLITGTQKQNLNDMYKRHRDKHLSGELVALSKLTQNQVDAIRKDNRTQIIIAKQYDVDRSQISRIKNMKTWRGPVDQTI